MSLGRGTGVAEGWLVTGAERGGPVRRRVKGEGRLGRGVSVVWRLGNAALWQVGGHAAHATVAGLPVGGDMVL